MIAWFEKTFSWMSKELLVFLISMVPILECRGGLLAAAGLGVDIVKAVPICIVGNLLPVPFILWFITPIFNWMKKTKLFRGLVEKIEKKAEGKTDKLENGAFWALVLFVGIPLPGTGAWTGSLIASMLNMKFKKAFPAVIIGVLLATVIMSAVSYGLFGAIAALF
ncbi:MAG: small multi-drug export protein [Clostridia bacterium]|nr:small multi-drug export protein [Clostridia bacterium]